MELLPLFVAFFNEIDVLMLILVRVTAFLIFLPIISGMSIPMQARLFVAFTMSIALFSTGAVTYVTFNDTPAGFIMLIFAEVMTGAFMGFILFFVFNVILFAGQFMDFSMGFAMVNVMDPVQQIQVPVLGNVLFMSASALLVVVGGLHVFIQAFFDSFRLIPIGGAFILGNAPLAEFITWSFVGFTTLAVRIALPIVGTMLIIDVCLGIMVKAVPQMNVFVIGMPLKVLVGLILVFTVMIPNLGFIYDTIFNRALDNMVSMIEGMMPYEPVYEPEF
ncbi:MAG: flagellar biosynthetic protein FliR [Defluviitaleaceae bacterium]|nr:flagellar biosynthetic protein FliR [Defluviitaleaceae bacterium]